MTDISSRLIRMIVALTIVTVIACAMLAFVLLNVLEGQSTQSRVVDFAAREKCARDITEQFFFDPVLRGLALLADPDSSDELQAHARQILDSLDKATLIERIEDECPRVES